MRVFCAFIRQNIENSIKLHNQKLTSFEVRLTPNIMTINHLLRVTVIPIYFHLQIDCLR